MRNNQTTTCSFTLTYEAPSTTTLHITKRGDRTGGGVTDGSPLGGATFEAYSTSSSWPNGPTGAALGTCTTDTSTGTCDITVENEDDGFWVVETSAPAGWHEVGSLGLGGSSATEYRFHVESGPDWRSNTVRDVPQDSDTSRLDDSDGWVNVRDNPAFPEKCGVSIALVFDTSGSISSSEMTSFKKAAKNFVGENALGGTPSTVTMLRFANTAQTMNGGASFNLSTESGWEDAQDEIDDLPNAGNGSTNWDHAMRLVKSTGNFDMVLFMTDGDPTQYGSTGSGGTGSSVQIANVEQAILSANAVKAEVGPGGSNTKIVGVGAGLGSNSDLNLAAISGPVAGEDYFLSSNFDTLASTLQDIATKNCGSTLTVVKQTVDAQGQVIDESADGWSMTASGANVDGSPSTQVTTNTGTNFELSFADGDSSGTVTVTETQKPGFSFDSATCQSGDDELPTSDPASGDGFVVDVGQGTIVTCVIVNKQAPASVTISKIWSVEDGDGTEIGSYSLPGDEGTLPSWMSAVPSIDATGTEWGAANDGFAPGQTVNIGESVDDDGTPPGCTLESQAVTAHNGETVDGAVPYGAKLTAGENTFTITNTVTCEQSLSLIKLVGYGDALPSEWTLSATPPTADDDAAAGPSGTCSDTTPVTAEVTPNIAYDLSEDGGPATYVSEGWVCVIDGTNTPAGGADGIVTVPLGENVTCTVTNVTASLTLFKHVDGDSNLEAGYWDLTATPGGSIAGLTPTTIDGIDGDASSPDAAATFDVRPGHTYTVSEALDAAHAGTPYRQLGLEKWDSASETWLPVTGDEVSVEAGEHAIYRLVNGSMPAFALPLTGGVGIDAIFLAGGLVLLLAAGLGLWQRRRTVRMSRP